MHTKTDQHELYDEYTEKLKTTYDETNVLYVRMYNEYIRYDYKNKSSLTTIFNFPHAYI